MKQAISLSLLILFIGFISCNKDKSNTLPTWNSDWLLPIAKGKVSFETLKTLSNIETTIQIPSIDLGYTGGAKVNVAPLNISKMGPYKIPLSNWIHKINFDSLELSLSMTNIFPIEISSGTKFSFRKTNDLNDPSNIIYQHILSQNIKSNDYYTFNVTVNNNSIYDTVYLFLEQFTSPGANEVIFSTQPLKIEVKVKVIDIKNVELYTGRVTSNIDTVDVQFSDEDNPTDTSSYGTVNLFVDNGLPIHFGVQIYFLEKNSNLIIDSLMSPAFELDGCNTDANGDPISVVSKKSSFQISTKRIENIKRAHKAIIRHNINTLGYPPPYVLLSKNSFLKMQITGDLHLSFNLNNL